ncbi:MAG: helix-turn-helix domain-containing protein [Alphaproteobacteria bacterium]|nr:helix-turn-helix domain-containing protein [Alphaproteobacteria bacterium]
MNRAQAVIAKFGSQSELARALSIKPSTVQYWSSQGRIPTKWHKPIIKAANQIGLHVSPSEFQKGSSLPILQQGEGAIVDFPSSPFAKWRGQIELGGDPIDCYVLDTGQRVIALRSAVKAIADAESGDLAKFTGVSALKPFINNELILAELVEFSIPGTQFTLHYVANAPTRIQSKINYLICIPHKNNAIISRFNGIQP